MFILAGLGSAAVGYAFYVYMQPGPLQDTKLVLIERGMGVSSIAGKLDTETVIASDLLFKIAALLKNSSLKAGEYEFPAKVSIAEALSMLEEGKVFDRSFTIREGLTSYQIVKRLNAVEELSGEIIDIPAEGSLLPETYRFISGDTKQQKLERMQQAMQDTIEELWPQRAGDLPFETIEDAITLASIIEMETGQADERAKVAGVFVNRLHKGMALQTDPTVIYALTKGKVQEEGRGPLGRRLLRKDLEVDDPYNTYVYPGLPPGPIANPGRASIEAALNPAKHEYLYFVADGTGGHAFSKTLAEHNANVAKWRQIRRSQ
ncbi:MAG: endolytic transglycosylase MltG [Pseudomonadota bacterium]